MVIGCDNGQRIGSVCTLTCSGRLADQFKVECLTDTKWHYSQDSSGFQFVDRDNDDAVSDYTTDFILEADTYDQVCYVGVSSEPAGTDTKPEPDVYVVTLVLDLIEGAQDAEEFAEDLTVALKDDTFVALLEEADYSEEFRDFALKYVDDNDSFRGTSNGRRRLLATDEEVVLDLIKFVDESVVVEFTAKANGEIVIDIQLQVSGDQDIQSTDEGAGTDPLSFNLEDMVGALTVTLNNENSTIARQFNVTSDSVTSISIGKLCADGTVDDGEGSCDDAGGQVNSTSDDGLLGMGQIVIIAIIAAVSLLIVVVVLLACLRQKRRRTSHTNVSTFKIHADATGLQNSASCRDDVITPPFDQEGKTGDAPLNDLVEIDIPPRGRGSYITPMGRREGTSNNSSELLPPMEISPTDLADTTAL
jgi:hypothetical protein